MRKSFVVFILMALCSMAAGAQPAPHIESSMDTMRPAGPEQRNLLHLLGRGGGGDVTDETVGDEHSFGRKVIYLGMKQTDSVVLQPDCSAFPPSDFSQCVTLNPMPAATFVDVDDLMTITLPGKSSKSLLCFAFTPFATWQFNNTTGVFQPSAVFNMVATIRIESEVLEDPTLIDPITGLPYGGFIDTGLGTYAEDRSLDVNEREFKRFTYTRSCIAGILSHGNLAASGLPEAVIRDIFRNPITLRFGIEGQVQMVDFASYFYGIRIYGDK